MLELWSGGRFRSTMHRVVPPAEIERYSIAYFVNPRHDTVITPLPGVAHRAPEGKPTCLHTGEDFARFVATFDRA